MGQRILFIIDRLTYGGAAKVMAFVANELCLEGYEISLLTYEKGGTVHSLAPGVRRVDLDLSLSSARGYRRLLQLVGIRKAINQTRPSAIVSFKTYPNILAILASVGMRVPVIISERGDPFVFRSWFTKFRDIVYNFADGYVFQTQGAKNYYSARIQAKAVVIPNPCFAREIPTRWTGVREDAIVNVGRFELKQKRQDLLIYAFSKLAGKYPNLKLVLYGDGGDESEIRRIIGRCNLDGQVILAGVTRNVHESIRRAKLFVLSSDYEGIPNALIEAMSVGLPCVSTDCSPGGAAELIKNLENGILVKPGCIDELADAMEFMLDNPTVAESMGQKATSVIDGLGPDAIIDQWKEYIEHHLSTRLGDMQI